MTGEGQEPWKGKKSAQHWGAVRTVGSHRSSPKDGGGKGQGTGEGTRFAIRHNQAVPGMRWWVGGWDVAVALAG